MDRPSLCLRLTLPPSLLLSVAVCLATPGPVLQVLGAQLPSGAPLQQRIRPAEYSAILFRRVCCAE